ncbi:MAG: nitroreductase family protein [Sphingobacteriales bacterium]
MDNLLKLIKARHSSRQLFDPNRPMQKDDLHKILEAASWAPTAHNMQNFELIFVDDKQVIGTIAAIEAPVSLAFVKENYAQLSFSEEELQKRKTGVLANTFPQSWLNPNVTAADINSDERGEFLTEELNSTPVLGIVLYEPARRAPASEGDFLGIISLGCVMENMWLMANSLGIDFHIVSSLSNGPYAKGIKKLLNIPEKFVIAYAFRLGHAVNPQKQLRVRRNVEDFAHHNSYGVKSIWSAVL